MRLQSCFYYTEIYDTARVKSNMENIEAINGAKRIVDFCADVKADENVLIVTDWVSEEIAGFISLAAEDAGANVTMTMMNPLEHHGNEPPEIVEGALMKADVGFGVAKTPMVHTNAVEHVLDATDLRWLELASYSIEQLISGGLFADFGRIDPKVEEVVDLFTNADSAKVTSPQGTNIEFDLEDRVGGYVSGFATEPGMIAGPGSIEANISPVEGTADGTLVIDGSIPDFGIGPVNNEVRMEIENGEVVDIEGGREARKIESIWTEYDNPAIYNVAQVAVGMNPKCRVFNNRLAEAHGRYGNVHVGIGHSSGFLEGEVRSPIHFDVMLSEATLRLDDQVIVKDGSEFVVFQ